MTNQPSEDLETPDMPPLFGSAEDWDFNACMMGYCESEKWQTYIRGYKQAADLLIDLIFEDRFMATMDTLVFPIVYNYRQYIELDLKCLMRSLDMMNNQPNTGNPGQCHYKHTHKLNALWGNIRSGLKQIGVSKPRESFDTITQILSEFEEIDPDSTSFRYPVNTRGDFSIPYPVDKKGIVGPKKLQYINIRQFRDGMQRLEEALQPIWHQVDCYQDEWE